MRNPINPVQTERWQQLCEQASKEQDTLKLLEIVDEINRLLLQPRPSSPTDRLTSSRKPLR